MTARSGALLGALALAVAAAAFFALGGPAALRGRAALGIDGAGGAAPESALAGAAADSHGAAAGPAAGGPGKTGEPGARLFGRPKAQRKGVGAVLLRVVRWRDQTPVAGAQLLLSGEGNGGEAVDARIATDASGVGSFPSLPAGDAYVLRVEAADEPSTVLPGVAVEAGSTRDLGTVFVGKKSGLAGRVVDERGAPVAGADVRAYAGQGVGEFASNLLDLIMTIDREPTPIARATSDAKGEFAIPDLSPGPITLRATATGKRQAVKSVRVGSEGAAAVGTTLVLEPGAFVGGIVVDGAGTPVPGAQISMLSQDGHDPDDMMFGRTFATTDGAGKFRASVPEGPAKLTAFVAAAGFATAIAPAFHAGDESVRIVLKGGARLDLVVLDRDTNRPIEGASVMIAVGETADENMDKGGGFAVATTDAQGTASVATQPGVVQTAMVSAPGHGSGMFSPSKSADGMAEMFGGPVENDLPAALEDGKTAKATIKLGAGYTMKGRVKDPQGNGIAGAELRAVGFLGGSTASVRSGSDGSYRLAGLTPMSMTVLVRAPGWVQSQEGLGGFGLFTDGDPKETPKPGSEIARDFAMRPAAIVRGRVVDAAGNGIAGAQVSVDGSSGSAEMFPGKIDSDGISGPDGSYVLFDVNPRAGESDVQIQDVEVVAKDSLPKEPDAKDAPLKAALAGKAPETESEKKNGIRIRAQADGWVSGTCEPFEAKEGGTTSAPPVVLGRGATLTGVVKDAGGHPVAGARVDASVSVSDGTHASWSSRGGRSTRSGDDGSFSFDVLAKGAVTLTVSAPGFAAGRRSVIIEASAGKLSTEVRLRPGVALRGRVLGADGRPVAGASVTVAENSLEGADGDDACVAPLSGKTDEHGDFSLSPLPQGRVKVLVAADGKRKATPTLVTGGGPSDVILEDRPAGDVKREKEIDAELSALLTKYGQAKTDGERTAIEKRMTELSEEKQRLKGSDSPMGG